jgi:hypothetical protein
MYISEYIPPPPGGISAFVIKRKNCEKEKEKGIKNVKENDERK